MSLEPMPMAAGVRVLRGTGEFDVGAAEHLSLRLADLVAGARAVVLDLSDVTFLDSAGVRLVEQLTRACRAVAAPFRVVAVPGTPPRRVLELVGMVTPTTVDGLSLALASLSDP